jgi:hypothetical protein
VHEHKRRTFAGEPVSDVLPIDLELPDLHTISVPVAGMSSGSSLCGCAVTNRNGKPVRRGSYDDRLDTKETSPNTLSSRHG